MADSAPEGRKILTRSGKAISFQAIQDFYHSITGKVEQTNDFFYAYHLVEPQDLYQLDHVVTQAIEPYSARQPELTISVKYVDGEAEQFSGMEKFKLQALDRPCGCESVEFDYRFLVFLPKSQEAREYTVSLGVRSSIGTLANMKRRKAAEAEYGFYFNFPPATAKLEITYVDLAVARAIQANINNWHSALRSNGSDGWIPPRVLSETARIAIRIAAICATAYSAYQTIIFSEASPAEERGLLALSFAAFLAVGYIAFPISAWAAQRIRRLGPQSLVVLSEADRDLARRHKRVSIGALLRALGSALLAVLLGLTTWYIAGWLGL